MFRNRMNKDFKFKTTSLIWPIWPKNKGCTKWGCGECSGRQTKQVNRDQNIEYYAYHAKTPGFVFREKAGQLSVKCLEAE